MAEVFDEEGTAWLLGLILANSEGKALTITRQQIEAFDGNGQLNLVVAEDGQTMEVSYVDAGVSEVDD